VSAGAADWTGMKEFLRGHDSVALEDQAVFQYENHASQGVDIIKRISFDGDEICRKSDF
jgi:hypothetical protein